MGRNTPLLCVVMVNTTLSGGASHPLRASQAKRAYLYYLNGIQDPAFRENLIKELEARWQFNKKKNWDPEKLEGTYYLRGRNRKFALEHNLPTAYNRLALMAVSVFICRTGAWTSRSATTFWRFENIKPTSEAILAHWWVSYLISVV